MAIGTTIFVIGLIWLLIVYPGFRRIVLWLALAAAVNALKSRLAPLEEDLTAQVIEAFLIKTGFTRFGLYAQDYGGPVGFRIVTRRPEWLEWLIIQNTNAYEVGFTAVWDGLRGAYWKNRTPETEKPLEAFLQPDTVKQVYTHGHPRPELISPDNWNMDLHYLDRPDARRVQLDFFYDYRTNVQLYPQWQAF